MQGGMKMADLPKDEDRSTVGSTVRSTVVRLFNNFIPQGTKVALELGKSVAYVEFGEHPQDV
jgi:hypothetical protein